MKNLSSASYGIRPRLMVQRYVLKYLNNLFNKSWISWRSCRDEWGAIWALNPLDLSWQHEIVGHDASTKRSRKQTSWSWWIIKKRKHQYCGHDPRHKHSGRKRRLQETDGEFRDHDAGLMASKIKEGEFWWSALKRRQWITFINGTRH